MDAVQSSSNSYTLAFNVLGIVLLIVACVLLVTALFGGLYTLLSELFLDTVAVAGDPNAYY
jgi:hypothetical protein